MEERGWLMHLETVLRRVNLVLGEGTKGNNGLGWIVFNERSFL